MTSEGLGPVRSGAPLHPKSGRCAVRAAVRDRADGHLVKANVPPGRRQAPLAKEEVFLHVEMREQAISWNTMATGRCSGGKSIRARHRSRPAQPGARIPVPGGGCRRPPPARWSCRSPSAQTTPSPGHRSRPSLACGRSWPHTEIELDHVPSSEGWPYGGRDEVVPCGLTSVLTVRSTQGHPGSGQSDARDITTCDSWPGI